MARTVAHVCACVCESICVYVYLVGIYLAVCLRYCLCLKKLAFLFGFSQSPWFQVTFTWADIHSSFFSAGRKIKDRWLAAGDLLGESCTTPLQCLSRPRSEWILSWSLDQTLASGSQRSSKQQAGLIFVRAPLRNRLGFTTQRIASWVSDPSAAVARSGAGKAALIFSFPMKLKARETRLSRWHIYFRNVLRPRKLSLVGHAAPQCGRRRGACVGVLWLNLFFGLEGNSLSTRIMSLGGWFISRGPGNGIRVLRLFTFLTVPSCSVAGGFSTLQSHGEPYL